MKTIQANHGYMIRLARTVDGGFSGALLDPGGQQTGLWHIGHTARDVVDYLNMEANELVGFTY